MDTSIYVATRMFSLQVFLSLQLLLARAAYGESDGTNICEGSPVAPWVDVGEMYNMSLSIPSICKQATVFFPGEETIMPLQIQSTCGTQSAFPGVQDIGIRFNRTSSSSRAQLLLMCGDGNHTVCLPFRVRESSHSMMKESMVIQQICHASNATQEAVPLSTNASSQRQPGAASELSSTWTQVASPTNDVYGSAPASDRPNGSSVHSAEMSMASGSADVPSSTDISVGSGVSTVTSASSSMAGSATPSQAADPATVQTSAQILPSSACTCP